MFVFFLFFPPIFTLSIVLFPYLHFRFCICHLSSIPPLPLPSPPFLHTPSPTPPPRNCTHTTLTHGTFTTALAPPTSVPPIHSPYFLPPPSLHLPSPSPPPPPPTPTFPLPLSPACVFS